jgi:hypothetical protein
MFSLTTLEGTPTIPLYGKVRKQLSGPDGIRTRDVNEGLTSKSHDWG